jgi:purine nucleosidase
LERRSSSRPLPGLARRLLLGVVLLAGLFLLSFAFPVRLWRTGEPPGPPLPLLRGGPPVELPRRVWIDTDAACGRGRATDPDDCFAILLLLGSPSVTVVGISTVHGNAPLAVTDSVTRRLVGMTSTPRPAVYRGSSRALGERGGRAPAPAHAALRRALAEGPLTLVALGPLTNIALALDDAPELRPGVARLVAVMGRRPGHLFHPAEGRGGGMLFGHGPVFTDFNFAQDREAGTRVLRLGLPTTLVPYEAARELILGAADLAAFARAGTAAAWVVERSQGWLEYWRDEVGLEGFYPFDLVGAAYALTREPFDCAHVQAWIAEDHRLWGRIGKPALLVGTGPGPEFRPRAEGPVVYCPGLAGDTHRWLMGALTSGPATPADRGP